MSELTLENEVLRKGLQNSVSASFRKEHHRGMELPPYCYPMGASGDKAVQE